MIAGKFRLCRMTGESRPMEKATYSIPRGPGMRSREGPGSSLIRARLPSGHDSERWHLACSRLRLAGPSMIRSDAVLGVPPTVGRNRPHGSSLRGRTSRRNSRRRNVSMRIRARGYAAAVGVTVLALVATACGGSSGSGSGSSSTGTSSGGGTFGLQGLNPGSGTPTKGGTLNMLGQGDVDFMDYNVSYYTIGALGQRPWLRLLYAYPATPGKTTTVEPDLATALPTVSNGGKTYSVTIRTGADWDTSPARQVTAADALLGLKRDCNPTQPFGGLPDFEALIVGYAQFCSGFSKVSSTSISAIKNYIDTHQISGVKASGQTITYNLVHPASYFPDMLQLDAFAPAPVESLNYLPASGAEGQHIIADGPYKIQSYVPTRSIVYVRNPAWKASTDPIRKAYVNEIKVSETGNEPAIQQQLQTNTASASMEFDAFPPVGADPGLEAQIGRAPSELQSL